MNARHFAKEMLPESLPGFDLEDGLARLGGDAELYAEMVVEYGSEFGDFKQRFSRLVEREAYAAARREAHSLKGASGNISAVDLYTAARALEEACVAEEPDRIALRLGPVEAALAVVAVSARRMAEALKMASASGAEPAEPAAPGMGREECLSAVRRLDERLSAFDPVNSEKIVAELKPCFPAPPLKEDFDRLRDQVSRYAFDAARRTLEKIRSALGAGANP